jgi:hypothetical protein
MVPDVNSAVRSYQAAELCISQNERASKHGRYFNPFFHCLDPQEDATTGEMESPTPLLVCMPFLDWTVYPGPPPPPRFQVDPYDLYRLSRSSSHMPRSMLQYYYRLEETQDREREQVFTKYRPWQGANTQTLQMNIKRWYRHEPTGLIADELWILVLDEGHIVTFSSNQSWKPAWPPHQLQARIAEVAFRSLRNTSHGLGRDKEFNALTHMTACLSGAVGLLHRSFWSDIVLPLTDRYGGYLSHLQYRIHRSPNTKLVMELLQTLDELNIVLQIVQHQRNIISTLQELVERTNALEAAADVVNSRPIGFRRQSTWGQSESNQPSEFSSQNFFFGEMSPRPKAKPFKPYTATNISNPFATILDNLNREHSDLRELRDNTSNLVNRTVQLVNIRLEDHGKAIMVFTIVTIVFLPLSFVSSFFGMNTIDIREMNNTQSVFWIVAGTLTTVIVGVALLIAFYGSSFIEKLFEWRGDRRFSPLPRKEASYKHGGATTGHGHYQKTSGTEGFKVLGAYSVPQELGY